MSDRITLELAGIPFTCRAADLVSALLKKQGIPAKPEPEALATHEGEIYVGAITDAKGTITHVFLQPGDFKGPWQKAMDWAFNNGGDLPTRVEQALLFATLKSEFKEEAYWSNTQYASDSDYAWYQLFYNGNQSTSHTTNKLRARAVRRLTIL